MAYASSNDIIKSKTAYVNGEKITGTIQSQIGSIVVPGKSKELICPEKRYTTSSMIVKGDANLLPKNINAGVTIFGVEGTYRSNDPPTGILPDGMCTVTVQEGNPDGGIVYGGGCVSSGMTMTVESIPNTSKGYKFYGWHDGNNIVSKDTNYTFKVKNSKNLTAVFSDKEIHPLPSGYTEVEYIENVDTSSYIITNRSISSNTIKIKFAFQVLSGKRLFEANTSSIAASSRYLTTSTSGNALYWYYKNTNGSYSQYNLGGYSNGVNTISGTANKSIRLNENNSVQFSSSSIFNVENVVFPSKISEIAAIEKIYYFSGSQSYPGGKNVNFELIPCKKNNGLVGLYDTINDEFIEPVGTFNAGPVIG